MKKLLFFFIFLCPILYLLIACTKEQANDTTPKTPDFKLGKNRFTLTIDGDEREYFVHVPANYTGKTAVPIVFMLHGTSGNGEEFYTDSGWNEVGEAEGILTAFPSSWRYCIITKGEQKNTTKWNSQPAEWLPCAGQKLRDDVKFLSNIIANMKAKFNVNDKRIYLVGFSNGGQMAAKCTIDMSDQFAAIVESASSFYVDTTYAPKSKIPTTFQVGSADFGPGEIKPAIPMRTFENSLKSRANRNGRVAFTHVNSFGLNPNFTIKGDTNVASIATYTSLTPNSTVNFQFIFVNGLRHSYPNGTNFPLNASKLNWEWLKQYSLP
jgi:polyhydroxybutyrate depolymerase